MFYLFTTRGEIFRMRYFIKLMVILSIVVIASCEVSSPPDSGRTSILKPTTEGEEAVKSYDEAKILINRANALNNLKRYADAVKDCDKAIDINPKLVEAWAIRGTALLNLNCYAESLESFDKAILAASPNRELVVEFTRGVAHGKLLACQKTQCPPCSYKNP
jgi:Tfp pilus assembly protein PilF